MTAAPSATAGRSRSDWICSESQISAEQQHRRERQGGEHGQRAHARADRPGQRDRGEQRGDDGADDELGWTAFSVHPSSAGSQMRRASSALGRVG
jgi:hypothetical protein